MNVVVDDTVQIWFVKLGVMYEVITFKGDEAWLVDILKTWQFQGGVWKSRGIDQRSPCR